MSRWTIYHNPRCSKSRAALEILEKRGVSPEIVEYLKTPPSTAQIRTLVRMLGIRAEELVRKGEDLYKSKYAGKSLTEAQWIEALASDPILIERPIVVAGERAVLARPPENVIRLF
jgi:arsenate reductase